jgi:predicted Zn-dependent peptidase
LARRQKDNREDAEGLSGCLGVWSFSALVDAAPVSHFTSEVYLISHVENGLTVATAEMPHMTSVSVGIWVGVGSRYESAKLNGACHFIEHLLFKGTKKRSARQISEAIEGVGGYLNAFTSEEVTCFHARAAHDRLPEILDVLFDMLLNSRFAPAEIEKEREVIKEEIAMYLDQPHHHVQEILNSMLWPDQPLGRPITGTEKTLNSLSRGPLLGYLAGNYLPGNTVIVAAGRLKHATLAKAVARYARGFKRGGRPRFVPAKDGQSAPVIRSVRKSSEQTHIALGFRTCSRYDPRRYALRLVNTILGENMSSRLFQIVREDHGLAYSIYSSPSLFADTGDFVISAGLDTDNLEKTLKLIVRELRRIRDRAPSPAETRRAQEYLIGQIDLGAESTESQMNNVGEQLLGYGRVMTPAQIKRRLLQTTPAQIRNAARDFFRPERLNLALVTPLKSDKHLRRAVRL